MKPAVGLLYLSCMIIFGCAATPSTNSTEELSIAFMPDIHFHDIYGDFPDQAFKGLPTKTPDGNQLATIRSMSAQLHSTRLFNENYFALLAALDDVVKRDIKYVALPGDFSDDGQPLHIRGLTKILDHYHQQYGLEFFAAPGNHDPTRPFTHPAGKSDYLGEQGKEQPIFSHQHPACVSKIKKPDAHSVICSDEVMEWGYEPIMNTLGSHGFYPKPNYLYFETPYSQYTYADYDYATARRQAAFSIRQYEICHQGTGGEYKQSHYSDCHWIPDSSYLVEPVPGVWLLAIDANVYQPHQKNNADEANADSFSGSGNAGYNKVISHKSHLLTWISDLTDRAAQQHKTLIAFSHFPMQEFYDGASTDIAQLLGEDKLQLARKPNTATSTLLADTGLKIHVAGHMHINDTGVIKSDSGNTLFNIQAPSLAAYVPAYKILTIHTDQRIEVETAVLRDVPRFNELFAHYLAEWSYLESVQSPHLWNKEILESDNYYAFTEWHLRELSRRRFLPQEWPEDIRELLGLLSGEDLLVLSQLSDEPDLGELKQLLAQKHNLSNDSSPKNGSWNQARIKAAELATQKGLSLDDFRRWNGRDISVDFYRLFNADQLALKDISPTRLQHYRLLAQHLANTLDDTGEEPNEYGQYRYRLQKVLQIILQFTGDAPSDHFMLDLKHGSIRPLS